MFGILKIRPIEAFLAKDEDTVGKMDPYVKIRVGMQAFQTIPAKGMGKTPVWNEEFIFNVKGDNSVRIDVYDSDIGKDEFIGKAKIMISQLAAVGMLDSNFPLHSKILGRNVGQIHLRLEFQPQQQPGMAMPAQPGMGMGIQQPGYMQGQGLVTGQGQSYAQGQQGQGYGTGQNQGYATGQNQGYGTGQGL